MNKAILIGNVGAEPEIRETRSGTVVANISLATNRKVDGEKQTEWHRVTFFGKKAELIEQYVGKGDQIMVEGRIKYGKYTDKEGIERNTTDINGYQIEFLGGGNNESRRDDRRGSRGFTPPDKPRKHDRGFPRY